MNFYNEHDPKAAAWLRELIAAGEIPKGRVDERSITEITPDELEPYAQCHFFAGIGGWSLALRLAGWPEDRPVWTGSCPCQPFSDAGLGLGTNDERHLWPAFFNLIWQRRPAIVIGEQVASKAALGWIDGVFADLESEDYACGAADLCAAGIGGPHIRQRLFWVANATGSPRPEQLGEPRRRLRRTPAESNAAERAGFGGMADSEQPRLEGHARDGYHGHESRREHADAVGSVAASGGAGRVAQPHSDGCDQTGRSVGATGNDGTFGNRGPSERMGDSESGGCGEQRDAAFKGRSGHAERTGWAGSCGMGNAESDDERRERESRPSDRRPEPAGRSGAWSNFDIIPCRDGKARRIESGTFPLVDGFPRGLVHSRDSGVPIIPKATAEARVMRLKGYGNAIVPALAAEFIAAYLETQ